MSKRMSILLIVLIIVSGLIGGAITGRIFTPKVAIADETKQSKVLTVEELRIVDSSGRLLMNLGAKGLSIYHRVGTEDIACLSLFGGDKPSIMLLGEGTSPEYPIGSCIIESHTMRVSAVGVIGKDKPVEKKLFQAGLSKDSKSGYVIVNSIDDLICSMSEFGINLFGKSGGADVSLDDNGGIISVYGKVDKKTRATMQINEYGSGAIGLWDKNGYRLK